MGILGDHLVKSHAHSEIIFILQVVSDLTYHRIAMHEGVDTHTLRKALWNYIHCLYGIRSVSLRSYSTNNVLMCFLFPLCH